MAAYNAWAFLAFSHLTGVTDATDYPHPVRTYMSLASLLSGDALQIAARIHTAIKVQIVMGAVLLVGSLVWWVGVRRRSQ